MRNTARVNEHAVDDTEPRAHSLLRKKARLYAVRERGGAGRG
jgi:hypothetical protein